MSTRVLDDSDLQGILVAQPGGGRILEVPGFAYGFGVHPTGEDVPRELQYTFVAVRARVDEGVREILVVVNRHGKVVCFRELAERDRQRLVE